MRGVILAGGLGTRLQPCTLVTNKHLLPVFNKPMIFYPIQTLVAGGVDDLRVVVGSHSAGDFVKLLGNGSQFGLKSISYSYQEGEGGIPEALKLCEDFAAGEPVAVCLGDNIFETRETSLSQHFWHAARGKATIFVKEVEEPNRYGVADIDKDGKLVGIVEKPEIPISNYAVSGLYIFPSDVFNVMRTLKPSARNETEITDVNSFYINEARMRYEKIEGFWVDGGSFPSLLQANLLMAKQHYAEKHNAKFDKLIGIVK